MKRTTGILIAALLVLVAARPAAAEDHTWVTSPHPSTGTKDSELADVAAIGQDDVWAVGRRWGFTGGALEFRTHALHWDGSVWTNPPTPDREGAPATNFLEGVDGVAGNDVWAVGWSRNPGQPVVTLIEHWNGSTWTIVNSPNPGAVGSTLVAVTAVAANDVWAVGYQRAQDIREWIPMVLHWDGLTWSGSPVEMPNWCRKRGELTDVADAGAGRVFAVGHCITREGEQSFVLRRRATGWSVVAGREIVPFGTVLLGIDFASPSQAWAVGQQTQSGKPVVALRWRNDVWSVDEVEGATDGATLRGVAASPGLGPIAVGAGASPQAPFAGPATLTRIDGTWIREVTDQSYGNMADVAIEPDGTVWAVGGMLGKTLVLRRT